MRDAFDVQNRAVFHSCKNYVTNGSFAWMFYIPGILEQNKNTITSTAYASIEQRYLPTSFHISLVQLSYIYPASTRWM